MSRARRGRVGAPPEAKVASAPRRADASTRGPGAGPRFHAGDRVRVRAADPPGHVRTPHYTRGCCGIVDSIAGAFANPEELAYGRKGEPPIPLYRVRFEQSALWADYEGAAHDTLVVDIYEHWLEPAPHGTRQSVEQDERQRKRGRRAPQAPAAGSVRATGTKPRRRDTGTYAR